MAVTEGKPYDPMCEWRRGGLELIRILMAVTGADAPCSVCERWYMHLIDYTSNYANVSLYCFNMYV